MKIYVLEKGIILTGKAWEIKRKLKESQHYKYVNEWIADVHLQDPYKSQKNLFTKA